MRGTIRIKITIIVTESKGDFYVYNGTYSCVNDGFRQYDLFLFTGNSYRDPRLDAYIHIIDFVSLCVYVVCVLFVCDA